MHCDTDRTLLEHKSLLVSGCTRGTATKKQERKKRASSAGGVIVVASIFLWTDRTFICRCIRDCFVFCSQAFKRHFLHADKFLFNDDSWLLKWVLAKRWICDISVRSYEIPLFCHSTSSVVVWAVNMRFLLNINLSLLSLAFSAPAIIFSSSTHQLKSWNVKCKCSSWGIWTLYCCLFLSSFYSVNQLLSVPLQSLHITPHTCFSQGTRRCGVTHSHHLPWVSCVTTTICLSKSPAAQRPGCVSHEKVFKFWVCAWGSASLCCTSQSWRSDPVCSNFSVEQLNDFTPVMHVNCWIKGTNNTCSKHIIIKSATLNIINVLCMFNLHYLQ